MDITRYGDWAEAARIASTMEAKFKRALEQSVLKEAHFLRGHIVKGIASQAPGGSAFAPLSPMTLALRKADGFGGSKALIRTGALRGSISVLRVPGKEAAAFVGVLRKSKSKDGKSLANIGQIQEFGATVPVTDKMRRYLWAKLRRAGITVQSGPKMPPTRDTKGRYKRQQATFGTGKNVFVIPPRPFIAPVIATYAKPADVKKRFYANVAAAMDGDWGRVAGGRI